MPDRPRYTFVVKGKYWRFRRGDITGALPGQPGQSAFHARYAELLALTEGKAPEQDRSSLSWLIAQYRASAEFSARRAATQLDYDRTLTLIEKEMGAEPFLFITSKMIKAVRDDFASTPRKAHKVKQLVSILYTWAEDSDLLPTGFINPATKIKRLNVRQKAITPWSEAEIILFLSHCPAHLRTAILLALYTGQRAEDVVTMDWTAYQGDFIRVRQSKTGEPLDIGCHPVLREHLDRIKTRFSGKIVRAASGKPYSANAFNKAIYDLGKKIPGWPGNRSPHGLRYAAAGRLEEAGVTPAEASAVLGHRTYQMAMKYLSQRKASALAIGRVGRQG